MALWRCIKPSPTCWICFFPPFLQPWGGGPGGTLPPAAAKAPPARSRCSAAFKGLTPALPRLRPCPSGFYGILLTPSAAPALRPFLRTLSLTFLLLEASPARPVPKKFRIPRSPGLQWGFLFPPLVPAFLLELTASKRLDGSKDSFNEVLLISFPDIQTPAGAERPGGTNSSLPVKFSQSCSLEAVGNG